MDGALNLHDHPGAMAGLGALYPNAATLIEANKEFLADEVMSWFDANNPGIHNATRHEKCERDTKFNIDALAHDIRYGGNSESIRTSKYY